MQRQILSVALILLIHSFTLSAEPLLIEAEEFKPMTPNGFRRAAWGENYYAATFGNTFLSRKAFLTAPPTADNASASIEIQVAAAGRYLPLVRYEAAYRFETQFRLQIEQAGAIRLNRLYGARDNTRIWPFGHRLKKETAWDWGAVENIVWEGHDSPVELQPGPAKLTLIAAAQPSPAANRNIDLILLTRDHDQVKHRIEKEGYLPLDGLLTQSGDVYLKIHNRSPTPLTVTIPPGKEHSPYWVHIRDWKPKTIKAPPQSSSDWEEVGSLLDTLNDGQWQLALKSSHSTDLQWRVEVGLRNAAGQIESIASFDGADSQLDLAYDADTRYSRRIRRAEDVLYELLDELKKDPPPGNPPKRTIIYAYSFDPRPKDAKYERARKEFIRLMGLTITRPDGETSAAVPAGYIDLRDQTPEQIEKSAQKLVREAKEENRPDPIGAIRTVSLGDEIGLPAPGKNADAAFRAWAQSKKLNLSDLDPAAPAFDAIKYSPNARQASPRLFYYSSLFRQDYGIDQLATLTAAVKKYFPSADTGANFSPHHGAHYLGEAHKWITLFRRGGMTMPWSEDYIWQVPIGSQQMNFLLLDLMRAANRYHPHRDIHFYVMPHFPGNTPNSWRRLFYGSLGHGMTIVNLFELRPVQAAYTENHVSSPSMYREIRKSLHELAEFEDIIQDGRPRPAAAVAFWYSQTGDIWNNHRDPFAAAKRTLYIALRHTQYPLDIVDEDDALRGTLANYRALYVADRNISRAATAAIADWVSAGGRLFTTAGAGLRDEFDRPNDAMAQLLGIKEISLDVAENLRFEKQDLPFAKPIDTISWVGATLAEILAPDIAHAIGQPPLKHVKVFSTRARIATNGAQAFGAFADGSPAATIRPVGKGAAIHCAFLPGLSYFQPAIPLRPADRGTTDDSMAHFIPADFDASALGLIGVPLMSVPLPIDCSDPLVEANLIQSKVGHAIILSNWRGRPIKSLTLALHPAPAYKTVQLATGGQVTVRVHHEFTEFTFDLDVADALILR